MPRHHTITVVQRISIFFGKYQYVLYLNASNIISDYKSDRFTFILHDVTICWTVATLSSHRNDRHLDLKTPFKHMLTESSYTSRITSCQSPCPKPLQRLTAFLHRFDPYTHLTRYHCSAPPRSSFAQKILSLHVSSLLTCTACIPLTYSAQTRHMLSLHFHLILTCLRSHGIPHVKHVYRPPMTCASHKHNY